MNRNSSVLKRICTSLRCYYVGLTLERAAREDETVLENGGRVSKYEIYGSVYVAVTKIDRSEDDRSATAWPFAGPAVFWNVRPLAMKRSPSIPGSHAMEPVVEPVVK
ncbi:Copper amine oxidase family protein [Raphanus sativus]|nr:Copper amine oxidase family protein [Raphanus sativus]